MPNDAEKQKRWLRAIYINGFAVGYGLCAKEHLSLPDQAIRQLARCEAFETYQRWGITTEELQAAAAYMLELYDTEAAKGKDNAE